MRIAILRDDITNRESSMDEIDNLVEANFAEKYLSKKHTTQQFAFVPDINKVVEDLRQFNPDVVFNLVESICDSDSMSVIAVQMLETLGIPFTGGRIYSQIVSANKTLSKEILQEHNIPTPTSEFKPKTKYILKARNEHASTALDESCIMQFISKKSMEKTLAQKRETTGFEWIAEQYIDGREFNCAFIGKEMLPPAEMLFLPTFTGYKILSYEAKWASESTAYKQSQRTFDIEPEVKNKLCALTERCRQELHINGYARIDYRMDADGNLYVIDINTNPCISPDSGFIAMVNKQKISIEKMFEKIVRNALIS